MWQESFTLLTGGTLSGLLSGIYLAFSIAVVPGFRDMPAQQHIVAMQRINVRIKNLLFLITFVGPSLALLVAVYQYRNDSAFALLALAAALHIVGNIGVTLMGNVPLNDQLDAVNVAQLADAEADHIRNEYQGAGARWMLLHHVRTAAITLATIIVLVAALSD